jgi:hypothetical protein
VQVSRSQLAGFMKSKLDLYNILAIEGQVYLPKISECPMKFISDLMNGRKKVSGLKSRLSRKPYRRSRTTRCA